MSVDYEIQGLNMYVGSCLCGAVKWQVDAALEQLHHCHCSMCRKLHGSAFATFSGVKPDAFKWLSGEQHVQLSKASESLTRSFCDCCGSSVPITVADRYLAILIGCLDDGPAQSAQAHILVDSKAAWSAIEDQLPRHAQFPGLRPTPERIHEPSARIPGDFPQGSCLCDAVAFELRGPVSRVYNCHCSRCRKARSAAFATNAVTTIDGVRFLRGEEHVQLFLLPEAKHFGHAFCTTCGSSMPQKDAARGRYSVPLGSMDDDPAVRAEHHIYAESKGPWYTWLSDLPTFASRSE
ncbi:MAG: hypothetical protein ACI9DC_000802 [Gammaproteobacteria bacterium]